MTDKKDNDPKKDRESDKEQMTKEEIIKKKIEELRKRDPFIYR